MTNNLQVIGDIFWLVNKYWQ